MQADTHKPLREIRIIVSKTGEIRFIHDDDLLEAFKETGIVTTRRASQVEPTAGGQWTADLRAVNGPVLGPFQRRDAALQEEVNWLRQNQIPKPT